MSVEYFIFHNKRENNGVRKLSHYRLKKSITHYMDNYFVLFND